jgi:RHS repeat-associated protein
MKLSSNHFVPAVVLMTSMASAQVATGVPPFSSFGGGPFDTVNLGNLNVHFVIPVLNKAGRGMPFSYNLSYDSSVWTPGTSNGVEQWQPASLWGWTNTYEAVLGYVLQTVGSGSGSCLSEAQKHVTYTYQYWLTDGYGDKLGVFHSAYIYTILYSPTASECGLSSTRTGSATASDGSGYTLSANLGTITVTSRSGQLIMAPIQGTAPSGSFTDANGNQITENTSGQFFDTLSSTTPVLTIAGNQTPTSPLTFTYTAPSGGSASYTVNYTQYTVKTDFGVSGVTEYGPLSNSLVSNIQLPDGKEYTFTYEKTPGSCTPLSGTYSTNCVTGRIASVTLPTGGEVTWAYSGGNNGIESDGSTAGLTRTLNPGGEWQYSRTLVTGTPGTKSTWTTTVIDPSSNYTVINSAEAANTNFYETQRQVYQGSVSPSNLLATSIRCYNAVYASCSTANVSAPISQTDIYSQLPNGSNPSLSEVTYNSYGLVTDDKEYNFGVTMGAAPGNTGLVRETSIAYATLSNGIYNKPSSVVVYDWTSSTKTEIASTTYAYDGTAVTATSGTPQQVSITGSRGNLTTITTSTSSTASLPQTFTYYDTGNPYVFTDINGAQTTYVYSSAANPYNSSLTASCGNSFATTIDEPLSLFRSMEWNCIGGITEQVTDENGQTVKSGYTDPDFWRPANVYDQESNETTITYIGETAVEAALQNFNGGNSTSDFRSTVDGFGRTTFSQRLQGPGATNYDTAETDYNSVGQPYRFTMPYSATGSPSSDNTTAPAITATYDALGRVLTSADADGGSVAYTYTNNDVLQKVSGTQTFQKQLEYDGLGRLTSVCEMSTTLPGVGACGQATPQTGYWTKYTYDALGRLLTVTQNAQAASGGQQTRTFAYDWLGRMTSESNPESGTTQYFWDTAAPSCSYGTVGTLSEKKDAAGVITCYYHDSLSRLGSIQIFSGTSEVCKNFIHDSISINSTPPTGYVLSNGAGRLVEAQTSDCQNQIVTDEWFSYSARGELTDFYESTPHSSGYYHTTASYWPTGTLHTLGGILGVPTIYYGASNGAGLDGEGRITQVTASSGTPNPVTGVTYSTTSTTNPLGALTGVTFGSADSDSFAYDPNTGRMGSYTFSVNGQTDVGTLTWNTNGTLQKMVINDQIPGTSDSQTCNYLYDDLQRLSTSNCGVLWTQNFTYDAFGNIQKNVPNGDGGLTFLPTYSTTNPNNQFTALPGITPKYDANGNLLTDNLNTYTWDTFGSMTTVSNGSTTVTNTYDAMGRMVENNAGGSYSEFVYGPTGAKLAKANGQTLIKAFVALPGGAKAIYNSTGLAYYRHSDWLGSSRLTSTASRTLYSSSAYAPFGEQYATSGTADASFTGQDQDTVSSLYDFPARRQSPSQGRWISPDPAGRGAVILTSPQSWNRYAYVNNNPLALTDPAGLSARHRRARGMDDDPEDPVCGDDDDCSGGGGGGGGGGSCDPTDPTCDPSDPGDPTDPTCGTQCQLQQVEQTDVNALNDPGCADAVAGGSPQAAATLGVNNGAASLATVQLGSVDPIPGVGLPAIETTAVPTYMYDSYGTPIIPTGFTVTMTINTASGGFFSGPPLAGYSTSLTQAIGLLHDTGHAANFNGLYTAVVTDDPAVVGVASPYISTENDVNIGNDCFPQGDFGGNQGPVDQPPTDVPAVAKPLRMH